MIQLGLVEHISNENDFAKVKVIGLDNHRYFYKVFDNHVRERLTLEGVVIFEPSKNSNSNIDENLIIPIEYSDFEVIMSFLSQDTILINKINQTFYSKYGNPYTKKVEYTFNLVFIALKYLFEKRDFKDVLSFFKSYFDNNFEEFNSCIFIDFYKKFRFVVKKKIDLNKDVVEEETKLILYFFAKINQNILCELWDNNLGHDFIQIVDKIEFYKLDNSKVLLDLNLLMNNINLDDSKHLKQISSNPDGDNLLCKVLLNKIEKIEKIIESKYNYILWSITLIKDEMIVEKIKDYYIKKLFKLLINHQDKDDIKTFLADYDIIYQLIKKEYSYEKIYKYTQLFIDDIDNEKAISIWLNYSSFKPDHKFFRKNYEKIKKSFNKIPEEVHKEKFKEALSLIGDIDDNINFIVLLSLVNELPIKVMDLFIDKLRFEKRIIIWLISKNNVFEKTYFDRYDESEYKINLDDAIKYLENTSNIKHFIDLLFALSCISEIRSSVDAHSNYSFFCLDERKSIASKFLDNVERDYIKLLKVFIIKFGDANIVRIFNIFLNKFNFFDELNEDDFSKILSIDFNSEKLETAFFNEVQKFVPKPIRVKLWFHGYNIRVTFEEVIQDLMNFSYEEQLMVLRKSFILIEPDIIKSNRDKYLSHLFQILNNLKINYNVLICVQCIKNISESEVFISQNQITEIMCNYLKENPSNLIEIVGIFEECPGITYIEEADRKDYWFGEIDGNLFPIHENCININNSSYKIDKDSKSFKANYKTYFFKWKKIECDFNLKLLKIPKGVKFCDAVECGEDEFYKKRFHWCSNQRCYDAQQTNHISLQWEHFTLRDFLRILGLTFEHDKYYRFVSLINKANRILEKLVCESCGRLMRDVKTSEFAFYRVTTFHCTNENCQEYRKRVYLSHCHTINCKNVIDSRMSKQCDNGWYICDSCGNCCSNFVLAARYSNLVENNVFDVNNPRHAELKNQVDNKLGHYDRGVKFDYKTGSEIE